MQKQHSLSIFFPAFNEAQNIKKTLLEALEVAERFAKDYEILVINDGSTDQTQEIVTELMQDHPRLKLINHPTNLGYGAALLSGFLNATKEWTFFSDADGQFDLNELDKLINYTGDFDVIIGYRKERNDPLMRLLNAFGWKVLNRMLFGLNVKDIDCAFKLIRSSVIKPVAEHVSSRGAMISAEILTRLGRMGYRFKEIPVTHHPRLAGVATGAKLGVITRALKEMFLVYQGDLGHALVKQLVKFAFVGVLNTVLDVTLYFLLSRYVGLFQSRLVWAKGIAYMVSTINSFLWNRSWTFRSQIKSHKTIMPFILLSFASVAINTGTMYVCLTALHLNELVSLVIATFVVFAWNFTTSKYLVFQQYTDVGPKVA